VKAELCAFQLSQWHGSRFKVYHQLDSETHDRRVYFQYAIAAEFQTLNFPPQI